MPAATKLIAMIRIGERIRKDLGDIESLAASIKDIGLIVPITLTPDGVLVSGQRRIEAVKLLGWTSIPFYTLDIEAMARGEHDENVKRKDFAPSELVAATRLIMPLAKDQARERMRGGKPLSKNDKGRAIEIITKATGRHWQTIEKAAEVVDAAERDPERFGHLQVEMDRTGKVTGAYRKLKQSKDEQRISGLVPIEGKFKTLVLDPPWDYDWLSIAGRAAPGYATMSHEELVDLEVAKWAEENCHLYCWTTNNFLTRAVELVATWGFQHKTVLTWIKKTSGGKDRFGMGSYFRNTTEHVLFAVRGELRTRSDSIPTHFEAPVGKHSEKPEEFYEIVRKQSYGPMAEAFQRTERPDFVNLYEEIGRERVRT